jgi:hypothetical protein
MFAITFSPRLVVRALTGERIEEVSVTGKGPAPLRLRVPLDIEYFNGAPHSGATIVMLPVGWSKGDYALDWSALITPVMSTRELDFRTLAVGSELNQWALASYPAQRLYPPQAPAGTPISVDALAELALSGHADQARLLLHRSWPRISGRSDIPVAGENAFWSAFCQTLVNHPLWRRFNLVRLPHARLIEIGAATRS